MLIDCPACARSYHVNRADIGEEGRTVICPRCDAHWFVTGEGTAVLGQAEDISAATVTRRPGSGEIDDGFEARPSLLRHARPVAFALICVVAAVAMLGGRERVVRLVPRTAGLYASIGLPVNLRGLEIAVMTPVRADAPPFDVTVSGEIRNVARKRVGVPRVTYEVRDRAGAPLATWTEPSAARVLAAGKTLPFVSTPHRLPAEAHSVLVRFEDEEQPAPVRLAHRSVN